MFLQTQNQICQKKTVSFKTTNSKSIIRIQKSRLLPPNFFKPLTIQVQQSKTPSLFNEELISTPCFGNHAQGDNLKSQTIKNLQPKENIDKKDFYSWFSKATKPLSSRVQTVPVQTQSSCDKKRHLTERKGRLERVRSVQEQGTRSTFKMYKKYEHLLGEKLQTVAKPQNCYKYRVKPTILEGIQKSYKNHFKVNNNMKRGYGQIKYKQMKALNSINESEKKDTKFLPFILSG